MPSHTKREGGKNGGNWGWKGGEEICQDTSHTSPQTQREAACVLAAWAPTGIAGIYMCLVFNIPGLRYLLLERTGVESKESPTCQFFSPRSHLSSWSPQDQLKALAKEETIFNRHLSSWPRSSLLSYLSRENKAHSHAGTWQPLGNCLLALLIIFNESCHLYPASYLRSGCGRQTISSLFQCT